VRAAGFGPGSRHLGTFEWRLGVVVVVIVAAAAVVAVVVVVADATSAFAGASVVAVGTAFVIVGPKRLGTD